MTIKKQNKEKSSDSIKNYYIYGKHPSVAALTNPKRKIIEIFCTQDFFVEHKKLIETYNYNVVDNFHIKNLLPRDALHQGIAVRTKAIATNIESIDLTDENIKIAILDQITDPQNVGAILRSAAAFGIKAIIMTHDNAAEENGIMAKTSCGGLETVPLIKVTNLKSTIDILKKHGLWIIGLDGKAKEFITPKVMSGKICIILGSEGSGMRRLTSENCDLLVKIPIDASMESINVSNAAAIVFYETYKSKLALDN